MGVYQGVWEATSQKSGGWKCGDSSEADPGCRGNKTELRLVPEVGTIQADGSLGELLRSGTVGEMIREKIRSAILSALQKGTNLSATLPPAAQGYATIDNAAFKDDGSGQLIVVLGGELRINKEQVQMLSKQV